MSKRQNSFTSDRVSNKRADLRANENELSKRKRVLNSKFASDPYYANIGALREHCVQVTVNGNTSSGKSTLANEIVGAVILPIGAQTVTMIPQIVTTERAEEGRHGYEVTWSSRNPIDMSGVSKTGRNVVANQTKSLGSEEEVFTHLLDVFGRYKKEDYVDRLFIKRFVTDPQYFHVLDVPGTGSLTLVRELMMARPTPVNVVVIGYGANAFKPQDGIFSEIAAVKDAHRQLNPVIVLNKIDLAVESDACTGSQSCTARVRCDKCTSSFPRFTEFVEQMLSQCEEMGATMFLTQSHPNARHTEEQNLEFIRNKWEESGKSTLSSGVLYGVASLREEISVRTTGHLDAEMYGKMEEILKEDIRRQEERIHAIEDCGNDLGQRFNSQLVFGADMIGVLEEEFISANITRSNGITQDMTYESALNDTMGRMPEDLTLDPETRRATHGDRHATEMYKHMLASDRLIDDTMERLSYASNDMATAILNGFEKRLYGALESHRLRFPEEEEFTGQKGDRTTEEIKAHWRDFRADCRTELAHTIRSTFVISKHSKQTRASEVERKKKHIEQFERLTRELTSSKTVEQKKNVFMSFIDNVLGTSGSKTGRPAVVPPEKRVADRAQKGTDVKTQDGFDVNSQEGAKKASERLVIDNPKYFSTDSRFYRDGEVYRSAVEGLERCMGDATVFIFNYVMELLTRQYPRDMQSHISLYNHGLMLKNREIVCEIKKRIADVQQTCQTIRELIRDMSK